MLTNKARIRIFLTQNSNIFVKKNLFAKLFKQIIRSLKVGSIHEMKNDKKSRDTASLNLHVQYTHCIILLKVVVYLPEKNVRVAASKLIGTACGRH